MDNKTLEQATRLESRIRQLDRDVSILKSPHYGVRVIVDGKGISYELETGLPIPIKGALIKDLEEKLKQAKDEFEAL